jgi:hypothetical protein
MFVFLEVLYGLYAKTKYSKLTNLTFMHSVIQTSWILEFPRLNKEIIFVISFMKFGMDGIA